MRNLGLDIVRFLAVLLVVGQHCHYPLNPHWIFEAWRNGGWIGVDLFFVISGFLISSLLFKEYQSTGTVNLKRFLVRRGFKIYPAFWIVTLFSILLFQATGLPKTRGEIIAELLFVQNYYPGVWLSSWSLAVEEHFYLGLAVIFRVLKAFTISRAIKVIPFLCILICCIAFYLRNERIYGEQHYFYFMHAFLTHLRIDSLCFGVLISYLVCFKDLLKKSEKIPALFFIVPGAVLLTPPFIYNREIYRWVMVWGVIVLYFGSALIVLGSLQLKTSKNKLLTFLGTLGSASYSIYLWHMPMKTWFIAAFHRLTHISNPNLDVIIYFLGSFGIGWMMYLLIEKPSLQLRDYFYKNSPKLLPHDSHFRLSPQAESR